ncbi:hypothetical protein [Paraburkholderia sp. J67]|uniref:hypothetical protein n=1 Tax=Paraburkholderia sp. J67 TaxID=2805435 RepID=UPI002ABD8E8C|nr:hypothetical protein [Paraburkholderia sp. J67]
MPEFTGDYKSGRMSVKNNILEVIGSFDNEINDFSHRLKCIKKRAKRIFHADFPDVSNWKDMERSGGQNTRDGAFMARHDVAAARMWCNAR